MNSRTKLYILIILLILVLLSTPILFSSIFSQQKNLAFESMSCSTEYADPWKPETLGVKEKTWVSQNSLAIKAFVSVNCADNIIAARYSVTNDSLQLRYFIDDPKQIQALCMCAKELNFTISNLPQKDYEIELIQRSNVLLTLGFTLQNFLGLDK